MAHDHFAQLDPSDTSVIDADHQEYPHNQQTAENDHQQHHGTDDEEDTSFGADRDDRPARQKKKLPLPLILGGSFIVFIALFAGYKKIFGHPAHASSVPTAVASLPADDSVNRNGNGSGGMMAPQGQTAAGNPSPLPAELPTAAPASPAAPASFTAADIGTASSPSATQPSAVSFQSQAPSMPDTIPVTGATSALPAAMQTQQGSIVAAAPQAQSNNVPSAAASASETNTMMSAAAFPASAPQDAPVETRAQKITRLEHELSQLRGKRPAPTHAKRLASAKLPEAATTDTASAEADTTSDATDQPVRHASTKAPRKGKRSRVLETQVGWHIKQVIPGQGWVEDENSGKQVVVSIGDRIGGAEVTKIDADGGKIYTTAGVIQ